MEYLPEKKRTQKMQVLKKEGKIRDFREYLADSEVVLAIVKCKIWFLNSDLLSVRSAQPWPQNPVEALKDYFGQIKDPMWDRMDEWKAENEQLREKIPELMKRIEEMGK